MPACSSCGHDNVNTAAFCANCGAPLPKSGGAKQDSPRGKGGRTGVSNKVTPGKRSRIVDGDQTNIGGAAPVGGGIPRTVIKPGRGAAPPPPPEPTQKKPPAEGKTQFWFEGIEYAELQEFSKENVIAKRLKLDRPETTIGKSGNYQYPSDPIMDDQHAKFTREILPDGTTKFQIHDLNSSYGTFLKLLAGTDEWPLVENAEFIIGQNRLRFLKAPSAPGIPGEKWQLGTLDENFEVYKTFPVKVDGVTIGRSGCDIEFPDDNLCSREHASITFHDGYYHLADTGSRNGTFIRIVEFEDLADGDHLLIGVHRFCFRIHTESKPDDKTQMF